MRKSSMELDFISHIRITW